MRRIGERGELSDKTKSSGKIGGKSGSCDRLVIKRSSQPKAKILSQFNRIDNELFVFGGPWPILHDLTAASYKDHGESGHEN